MKTTHGFITAEDRFNKLVGKYSAEFVGHKPAIDSGHETDNDWENTPE